MNGPQWLHLDNQILVEQKTVFMISDPLQNRYYNMLDRQNENVKATIATK